ncbi:MAG: hypothetical protein H0W68_04650 [Gemmatimonadaceae bacterium]|nr:hypothetical protein [Gemmatimonadaceae bacterium]
MNAERMDRLRLAGFGFLGGAMAGLLVWGAQVHRSRRELFHQSPVRRLAALGYLTGQPGAETARVLTDYLRWETNPLLLRRGTLLLRRMRDHLD